MWTARAARIGVIEGWGWLPARTTEEDEELDRRADGEEEEAVFKAEPEVYDTFFDLFFRRTIGG